MSSSRPFLKAKIDEVAANEKRFVVYAATADDDFADRFATRNVAVTHRILPDVGQNGFVVIRDQDGLQGVIGIATLREFLTPAVSLSKTAEIDTAEFRSFLTLLDDTLFRSMDRRQLILTSQEIEDRAWRYGTGQLHVGFQSLTAFRTQLSKYRLLANRPQLSIHVYGRSDWIPPDHTGITVHSESNDEIGDVWFLVYDGGGEDNIKCALLAEQQGSNTYHGFWTYDPTTVDQIVAYLQQTYG